MPDLSANRSKPIQPVWQIMVLKILVFLKLFEKLIRKTFKLGNSQKNVEPILQILPEF